MKVDRVWGDVLLCITLGTAPVCPRPHLPERSRGCIRRQIMEIPGGKAASALLLRRLLSGQESYVCSENTLGRDWAEGA